MSTAFPDPRDSTPAPDASPAQHTSAAEPSPALRHPGGDAPATPNTQAGAPEPQEERRYRSGPNLLAITLGVLAAVASGLVFAHQLGGVDVTRAAVLPTVVLAVGGLCVLVGVVGLVRRALARR